MKNRNLPRLAGGVMVAGMLLPTTSSYAADAEQIIRDNCLLCHSEENASAPNLAA